jgi:hypothetical protein
MKSLSLIIFILFNYFFIQKYFGNHNVKINNEIDYQKTFNEPVDSKITISYNNNIMEDKKEIIYLY